MVVITLRTGDRFQEGVLKQEVKLFKVKLYFGVLILVLLALLAGACAKPTPAPVPPAPTPPAPPVPSNGTPLAPTTGEPEPATPLQIEVAIEGSAFNPAILPAPPPAPSSLPPNAPAPTPAPNLPVGTTVLWYNIDSVTHTVTARDNLFDSGKLAPNQTYEYTFNHSGTLEYYCKIHPSVVGKITIE